MDLNQAFKSTCKVLFGQELGELSEFEPYLKEMMLPFQTAKSYISGKEVLLSSPLYPKDAKFISQEEMEKVGPRQFNINEIKDIDSLLEAANEQRIFCGNKIFGKCDNVEKVDNCVDCSNLYYAHNTLRLRNSAYTTYQRESEFIFGVSGFPNSKYVMRSLEGIGLTRCFETYYATNLSDCYFAFNCSGCSECIFAFNLRSKRYAIGNLELEKSGYLQLKEKLIGEMAEKLKKDKRLFSMPEISFHGKTREVEEKKIPESPVPKKIEEAFESTTKVILGKERKSIKKYKDWLKRRTFNIVKVAGKLGDPAYRVKSLPIVKDINPERLASLKDALESSSYHAEVSSDTTLSSLFDWAAKNAYFSMEFIDGFHENTFDTPSVFSSTNIYDLWDTTNAKNAAYSTAAVHSEYVFGGYLRVLHSQFCINCYDVFNCKACFEVDCSNYVYNSYFCHNCENVDNGIFCFNVKSKRYAVLNEEVGREEFMRIKKILLEYLNKQLDSGSVREDIFRT
jgi:hypothetical protein